jgi:hydroxypyruvate reductase
MAAVLYGAFGDEVIGAIVTRYGHGADVDTGPIERLESAHPVPDQNGVIAATKIVEYANDAAADDLVIFLVSGGGSALLTLPLESVGLEKMASITDHLVKSGAPISDINCVRRHLSQVKGGRLASIVAPAKLITLSISDVVGDNPADIASGPTVPAMHEPARVMRILESAEYPVDERLKSAVESNIADEISESSYHIIAKAKDALDSVTEALIADDWTITDLGENLTGDATAIAREHALRVKACLGNGIKTAFVSGGELTVDVNNHDGAGGPNLEYLAALAGALPSGAPYEAIACDSDGIDGSMDNAGGYISGETLRKLEDSSFDINGALRNNTTYFLFEAIDQLVITGPSGTNVNDIRIILVNDNNDGNGQMHLTSERS